MQYRSMEYRTGLRQVPYSCTQQPAILHRQVTYSLYIIQRHAPPLCAKTQHAGSGHTNTSMSTPHPLKHGLAYWKVRGTRRFIHSQLCTIHRQSTQRRSPGPRLCCPTTYCPSSSRIVLILKSYAGRGMPANPTTMLPPSTRQHKTLSMLPKSIASAPVPIRISPPWYVVTT